MTLRYTSKGDILLAIDVLKIVVNRTTDKTLKASLLRVMVEMEQMIL